MLVFQIKDDKEHILEKNLKRQSKKMILRQDDQGQWSSYCLVIVQSPDDHPAIILLSFNYHPVIIPLSSSYHPVIIQLSSIYHPFIIQLSSSYHPVVIPLSSSYHPVIIQLLLSFIKLFNGDLLCKFIQTYKYFLGRTPRHVAVLYF